MAQTLRLLWFQRLTRRSANQITPPKKAIKTAFDMISSHLSIDLTLVALIPVWVDVRGVKAWLAMERCAVPKVLFCIDLSANLSTVLEHFGTVFDLLKRPSSAI